VPVCNHLYGKGSKVQVSATAAMSARQYLDRLETETSAARLRQRKVLDFHSTKLNNYLNTIRAHRDDREVVEVLLNSFFRGVQSCADHLEYASGSFSRTIHRTGYKWVHTFLYDQVMRGDLDSSWHHYVASLEEFAFTLGVDLGDTMLDKTHHLWHRALNSDTSIMTVAPKINSNSGNSASTQNQPSGPVEEPNTTWKSVQPLQFSSTKDLAEALVRPEYLTICEQEMGALAERLRNGPQSIEFAIVGQTAVGLVSFGCNSQNVWFDTSRFVVLGKSWIEMIFELRNGLAYPSWKWSCTQEAVYGLSRYAERVCIMFNALQQSNPSVLPAPDATNGSAVQNTLPINSGDDVEAMVVCPPDTPSPQPTNNNFFQSSFFGPSQNANGPSNTFGSSNGSSAAFVSSAIGLGPSGSFGSSAGTLRSSFGSNSASSFTPGRSQAGTAAPTQQAILFTNLKDLVIALTARILLRGCQIETNRLQVKLKKPGLSVGPDEYKHFAKGILYFEFGQSRGLFINKQQVVQDGWSWFDLVVKLREILNTLLGAQATNADTFTAFRKQVTKVFRFVKANTVAPPTQTSSSLLATIGTQSAVLDASDIAMGDPPDDMATTSALSKGKDKVADSPAPVQKTLAIFAGDSTKFSSHAMLVNALNNTVFISEMKKEKTSLTGAIRLGLKVTAANMPLLWASICRVWNAHNDTWFNGPAIKSDAKQWSSSMFGLRSSLKGLGTTSLQKSEDLGDFKGMLEELMGWLHGDATPAGSCASSSNSSGSPSGSSPSESGGAPFGGAAGPSSPPDIPSNAPVAEAITSSSDSSLPSTLDNGKGKLVSRTAPPQSLASFDIAKLTKLDGLSSALKNPVFLGELAFECVSVTEMVTKQWNVSKADMLLLFGSLETVYDASEDADWFDGAVLAAAVPEWQSAMDALASCLNGESATASLKKSSDLRYIMACLNLVLKLLLPDFSSLPLSALVSGTGPFSLDSITDVYYLEAMVRYPALAQWLIDSYAMLQESVVANRNFDEASVRPFHIICKWITHSAQQTWWDCRSCAGSLDVAAVRSILDSLNVQVLARPAKVGDPEARALQRDIKAMNDRLDGIAEQPVQPRAIKALKPRRPRG
jgi:hypothetical protein